MDRSLITLISQSAKNLLDPSPRFEPLVPHSIRNGIEALQFLGGLATATRESLAPPAPPSTLTATSNASPKTIAIGKSRDLRTQDKLLLEKLRRIQNAQSSFKRGSGLSSTILRPTSP